MTISIIAAVASNGVIGGDNQLLWHYPKDLKRFAELTKKSGIVIMGRKTHESLGKLLPGRINLVLTKDESYRSPFGGTVFYHKRDIVGVLEYFDYFSSGREVFVIGGEEIYKTFLPHANKLYITNINAPFKGDAYFPDINTLEWKHIAEECHPADDKHLYPFSFDTYTRVKP